jgi:5-methylcytosine-specific restriction endonuclease McrA
MAKGYRPDQNNSAHRRQFEINKKKIYATQSICGICGHPVDFNAKFPDPMSPCIDHIIPIAKGGHPSDIDNLQLAHLICNREKSDKLFRRIEVKKDTQILNDNLPLSMDWTKYRKRKKL